MQLHTIDWIIAFFAVAICFIPALFFGKRSGKSTAEFFASGPLGARGGWPGSPWSRPPSPATRRTWWRTSSARRASPATGSGGPSR